MDEKCFKIRINFGSNDCTARDVDGDVGKSVVFRSRRVRRGQKRDAVYAYGWNYDQTNLSRDRRKEQRGGAVPKTKLVERLTLIHMCSAVKEENRPMWICTLPNGTYRVDLTYGDPSFKSCASRLMLRCKLGQINELKLDALDAGNTNIISTMIEVKGNEIEMYSATSSESIQNFKENKRRAPRLMFLELTCDWNELGKNPSNEMIGRFYTFDDENREEEDKMKIDFMMRGPVDEKNRFLVPYADDDSRRETKIVATLFPKASGPKLLPQALKTIDIVRLNCSYFDKDKYEDIVNRVQIFQQRNKQHNVQIMIDLQGIKFRISALDKNRSEGKNLCLNRGDYIEFGIARDENDLCRSGRLTTPDTQSTLALFKVLHKHSLLDFADGRHTCKVVRKVSSCELVLRVLRTSGYLSGHAGVSARNLDLSTLDCDCMTEKDISNAKWALGLNKCDDDKNPVVDWINLSFVRNERDVFEIVDLMNRLNISQSRRPKICVKIETAESLRRIDRILELCDGIMVARGDLGLAIGLSRVPYVQKLLVRQCREANKFVIVATGMLESMYEEKSGVPTRSDISDIQNAVFEGCNAVMLSGETAGGAHPLESIQVMASAVRQADFVKKRFMTADVKATTTTFDGKHDDDDDDDDDDDVISTKINTIPSPTKTKPNILVLFGPPGSGKGTQSRILSSRSPRWVHVDFGQSLRNAVRNRTKIGQQIVKSGFFEAGMFESFDVEAREHCFLSLSLSLTHTYTYIYIPFRLLDEYIHTSNTRKNFAT